MIPPTGAGGRHVYLVALGSNMRARGMRPRHVLTAAIEALATLGFEIAATSPIISSAPLGPSARRYVNGAVVIAGDRGPVETLCALHEVEQNFGRRRRGQRWRARSLDLDIVLWNGGVFADARLIIPHPRFRTRRFVLDPAAAIAPNWRDPVSGRTLRQLAGRLRRPHPV